MRRLEAAKLLGWTEVPALVINVDDPRRAEADENRKRANFTVSEDLAIEDYFKRIEAEKAKDAQVVAGDRGKEGGRGHKKNPSAKFAEGFDDRSNRDARRPCWLEGITTHRGDVFLL
jgi:ParB-like chromosome segregation protein Spo0J